MMPLLDGHSGLNETRLLMAFVPGSRLGPYEIRGTLGARGMGTVYRANDPRLVCTNAEHLRRNGHSDAEWAAL